MYDYRKVPKNARTGLSPGIARLYRIIPVSYDEKGRIRITAQKGDDNLKCTLEDLKFISDREFILARKRVSKEEMDLALKTLYPKTPKKP